MIRRRLEEIDAVPRPFSGETSPRSGAHVHDIIRRLGLEGTELATGARRHGVVPILGCEIKPVRRQGAVVIFSFSLFSRREGVAHECQAFVAGLHRQMVETDQAFGRKIVEQGLKMIVK